MADVVVVVAIVLVVVDLVPFRLLWRVELPVVVAVVVMEEEECHQSKQDVDWVVSLELSRSTQSWVNVYHSVRIESTESPRQISWDPMHSWVVDRTRSKYLSIL